MIRTTLRFGLLLFFFAGYSQNKHPLVKYYDGELKLTEEQIDSVIVQILEENSSDYLSALALYQKGINLKNDGNHLLEFTSYSSALDYLEKADTSDYFLHSAILRNQGAILHNYRLYKEAVILYQQALDPSYKYNMKRGISTEYNIALSMIQYDPKHALSLFLKLNNKVKDDPTRQARIYNQIGLFEKRTNNHSEALSYFEKGLALEINERVRADLLQNISDLYYQENDYINQERYLLQVLDISRANRFIALMDLGECYILQNRKEEAFIALKEAEKLYDAQSLKPKHFKIFKWLKTISDTPMEHAEKLIVEQEKYIERMDQFKELMKTQAMKNALDAAESERRRQKDTARYSAIAMIGGILALLILLTWKIWWYQLKRSIEKNIPRVEN